MPANISRWWFQLSCNFYRCLSFALSLIPVSKLTHLQSVVVVRYVVASFAPQFSCANWWGAVSYFNSAQKFDSWTLRSLANTMCAIFFYQCQGKFSNTKGHTSPAAHSNRAKKALTGSGLFWDLFSKVYANASCSGGTTCFLRLSTPSSHTRLFSGVT